jgi:hypothetical protein
MNRTAPVPWYVTQTSACCGQSQPVPALRQAQLAPPGVRPGPDTDTIPCSPPSRYDDCHFGTAAVPALTTMWVAALTANN